MREIVSRDNPKIKNIIKLVNEKRYRKEQNMFVCEGLVNLKEAVRSKADIAEIYTTEEHMDFADSIEGCDKYLVPLKLIESMSDVKTPQGIVFSCRIKKSDRLKKGAVLALENVRDSGNLGTILRTAEGLGIENIVLLGECADVYNPKTVRASMGSVFRINPPVMSLEEISEWAKSENMSIFATALSEDAEDIRTKNLKSAVVVIGNEANGVSKEVLLKSDGHIIIPIKSAQSFNASVAAALVLWEMVR